MICHRVHLYSNSTLDLPESDTEEIFLASLGISDNTIGFLAVIELRLNLQVLPHYPLFHLIQIYRIYLIDLILLCLRNAGVQVKMELIVEFVIF